MPRRLRPLGSVLLSLLAALAACSGGDGDVSAPGPDAAASDGGAADTSLGRGGPDAGDAAATSRDAGDATTTSPDAGDSSPPDDASDASAVPDGDASGTGTTDPNDADVPPTGTQLVPGAVDLQGVTSDGYVVYFEAKALKAMPLAGGPAVNLTPQGPTGRAPYIDRHRPGVVLNQNVGTAIGVYAWTVATGLRLITTAGWADSARALSPDGSLIAYAAGNASSPSSFGVANTDGSNAVTLQALESGSDYTMASFVSSDTLALRHCYATFPCTLSTFVGPSFTRTLTLDGATEGMMDPTGRWLWPVTQLYDVKTGAVVFSDPGAQGSGVFDASGEHLFYLRSDGSLMEVATASSTATVLLPGGCLEIYALSPDGTEVLCRTQGPNNSVAIVGVATGMPAPPWPLFTAGTSPYSEFTADSRELLILSGSDLYVVPAKGGASRLMLPGAYKAPGVILLRGSRFLAFDSGSDDWSLYDASGVVPPSTLVSHTQSLAIAADLDAVAYVVDGAYAGLYVAPLP